MPGDKDNMPSAEEAIDILLGKIVEFEERINLLHDDVKSLNNAIDMLIRFSVTSKAFMELAIAEGLIDPARLQRLAARYEANYDDGINRSREHPDLGTKSF